MSRFFTYYGMAILGLMTFGHFYGWSWMDAERVPNVPKSVRDNPGSYRAHYTSHTHYTGGK